MDDCATFRRSETAVMCFFRMPFSQSLASRLDCERRGCLAANYRGGLVDEFVVLNGGDHQHHPCLDSLLQQLRALNVSPRDIAFALTMTPAIGIMR